MSTTSSSTVTTERSSMSETSVGLPSIGHVSRMRSNWLVYEDGALAERLQSEEITSHLSNNRRKNNQIREDFPKAFEEQSRERDQVQQWMEDRRRVLLEQEKVDEEVAKRVALELSDAEVARRLADDDRRYEVERDRVFADRLQRTAATQRHHFQQPHQSQSQQQHHHHHQQQQQPQQQQQQQNRHQSQPSPHGPLQNQHQPAVPQPRGVSLIGRQFPPPSPSTPPLPVTSTGDVPTGDVNIDENDVLPQFRGGLRYNDEQYLVKLARPAVVTAEPVYANNRPEHYAVSARFPMPLMDTGAIAKTPRPLGPGLPGIPDTAPMASDVLLGAVGLSQRDLALSKRAEEQLEQERRDAELARRLQQQLNMEEPESEDAKLAQEERDREYAKMLYAKEQAKLQRAKERSRLKKLQRQQQHQLTETEEVDRQESHHERSSSQPLSLGATSRTESRQSRHSENGLQSANGRPFDENGRHSRTSANSRSFDENMRPPARRPYLNPGAIDSHRSEFAVQQDENEDDEAEDEGSEEEVANNAEKELEEPQYANIGPAAAQAIREELLREGRMSFIHHGDSPVPPYMPMQQQISKKSTSLEKRINKKKEKEGCKQQ